jgi:hypothetical protein
MARFRAGVDIEIIPESNRAFSQWFETLILRLLQPPVLTFGFALLAAGGL